MGSQLSCGLKTIYSGSSCRLGILVLRRNYRWPVHCRIYCHESAQSHLNPVWAVHCHRGRHPLGASAAGFAAACGLYSAGSRAGSHLSRTASRNARSVRKGALGEADGVSDGCSLYGDDLPSPSLRSHRCPGEHCLVSVCRACMLGMDVVEHGNSKPPLESPISRRAPRNEAPVITIAPLWGGPARFHLLRRKSRKLESAHRLSPRVSTLQRRACPSVHWV